MTRTKQRALANWPDNAVSVLDFGAVGDGVTDDASAIRSALASTDTLYIPEGTYVIGSNLTVDKLVTLAPGAVLKPANGVFIDFKTTFEAGRSQIFDITNSSDIRSSRMNSFCYPEWFGAVIDSVPNAAVNLSAFNAALNSFSELRLAGGDYFVSDTIEITSSFKAIIGTQEGIGANTANGQTRIAVTNSTSDVIHVYTPGSPTDKNLFITDIRLEHLQLARTSSPSIVDTSNYKLSCTGLRLEFCKWVKATKVWCANHIIGVYVSTTVRIYLRDVNVLRTTTGSTTGLNISYGFYLDGVDPIPGFVSNNASLYMEGCSHTVDSSLTELLDNTNDGISKGIFYRGIASDFFLNDFELARCKTGIEFAFSAPDPNLEKKGAQDIHIRNIVLDVISEFGIKITGMQDKNNVIRLDGGYIHMTPNTATLDDGQAPPIGRPIGIYTNNISANVTINNMQIIGRSLNSVGIRLDTDKNTVMRDVSLIECDAPLWIRGGYANVFEGSITNSTIHPVADSAILLFNVSRCLMNPSIDGDADSFDTGIKFDGTVMNYNEVDTTRINSQAVVNGAAQILFWDQAYVTGQGQGVQTSTNLSNQKLLKTGFVI